MPYPSYTLFIGVMGENDATGRGRGSSGGRPPWRRSVKGGPAGAWADQAPLVLSVPGPGHLVGTRCVESDFNAFISGNIQKNIPNRFLCFSLISIILV
ncbi:hypothetical protein TNIN_433761 [Trichonephila inaurata madagascariensis]|uniref:Uncharacterized protein n=1 Tax=Trichonephila inaurata madagascariensis TaxID=2747483 RepID=A0A8X6XB51_9ARAC|nr:hypothetical protein TNIN_433761 [Trichonephila inaurata madagascariensis]